MITPADDGGAAPDGPVAVISHRLWRQRFVGASDASGDSSPWGAYHSRSSA
jgi:hypothetical protein